MSATTASHICIFGAGSVGCYLGGRLLQAGAKVSFIGRERIGTELRRHGLRLTDHRGLDIHLEADCIDFATDPRAASAADMVLVTVKSAATAEAGTTLAPVLRSGTLIISFQNGLRNTDVLRKAMPEQCVLPGIVEFNVVHRGSGHFHQGSDGRLAAQQHAALESRLAVFARAGLPLALHRDLAALQWGKLLLNLNNPINALSDLPLREELGQRGYRRCLALAQRELLAALEAGGLTAARLTPLPPRWMPRVLELPDAMFRLVARRSLAIDPLARSSMWEDLQAGRATEVDVLNGEVVALAQSCGRVAPVNARLVELVHAAEKGAQRRWTANELLRSLEAGS